MGTKIRLSELASAVFSSARCLFSFLSVRALRGGHPAENKYCLPELVAFDALGMRGAAMQTANEGHGSSEVFQADFKQFFTRYNEPSCRAQVWIGAEAS